MHAYIIFQGWKFDHENLIHENLTFKQNLGLKQKIGYTVTLLGQLAKQTVRYKQAIT